jgi:hypothetical protein
MAVPSWICGSRFFDDHHCQFMKDGGTMAFYGGLKWWICGFLLWSAI